MALFPQIMTTMSDLWILYCGLNGVCMFSPGVESKCPLTGTLKIFLLHSNLIKLPTIYPLFLVFMLPLPLCINETAV